MSDYSSTYGIMVFGDNAVFGYNETEFALEIHIPSYIYNNIYVESDMLNPTFYSTIANEVNITSEIS